MDGLEIIMLSIPELTEHSQGEHGSSLKFQGSGMHQILCLWATGAFSTAYFVCAHMTTIIILSVIIPEKLLILHMLTGMYHQSITLPTNRENSPLIIENRPLFKYD